MYTISKKYSFKSVLLNWYDDNARKFPWRSTKDPYRIWLSEIMLQQTRVKTVISYYSAWLDDLPNINSVSKVRLEFILKKWEGLGYYARARNFHSACRIVVKNFNGIVPDDMGKFQSLPGVGPYISGAVMSIVYNQPIPAIDSNAYRVVSRIKCINLPFKKSNKKIVNILSNLISYNRPGDFNQAIMDLGREVCTVTNPLCDICPVQDYCMAFVNNVVDKYPVKIVKIKKPHYKVAVGVIWKNNKILISKRKETGLLGGLWEFPGGKIINGEGPKKCIIREVDEELGICIKPNNFLKQINHAYTHFSITLYAYKCEYINGSPRAIGCADWKWVKPAQLSQFPFPGANHKLFDKIINKP